MTYYLINTDGFYNGDRSNDPSDRVEWATEPTDWSSYGGDLAGVFLQTGYIESLDPDVIMLAPIFSASSNHKLDPRDYRTIDPAYGDTNDLRRLINVIHGMDKRIVLSVVCTQTGDDFPAFTDVVQNGALSQYLNWYRIESWPDDSAGFKYASWRSDPRFPLLNLRDTQLHNYLISFIEYWAHFGFDGFYIGEHEEIDPGFMGALYDHMKARYPELLLLSSDCRIDKEQRSDGCYNKALTETLIDYFVAGHINTTQFDSIVRNELFFNPPQINCARLIGLHDYSRRIASIANPNLVEMLYAFLFTYCGSPIVVYGDEIGMTDCAPFNWGSFKWNTEQQNRTLLNRIREFIKIRKENPVIRDRHFFTLYIDNIKKVYAYDRGGIIVAMNSGSDHSYVELPAWDGTYIELMSGEKHTAYSQKLRLSIDPMSYRILKRET
jgi:glycosidase